MSDWPVYSILTVLFEQALAVLISLLFSLVSKLACVCEASHKGEEEAILIRD